MEDEDVVWAPHLQSSEMEVAIAGLAGGKSREGLEVVHISRVKGLGVRTLTPIPKGSFVTEYKYSIIHKTSCAKATAEAEYKKNGEGCYILEAFVDGKKVFLDATRKFKSYGRYLNHSRGEENLKAHRPLFVNGMPRVAFLASRDIAAGEELLWDYGADTRYSPKWMKGTKKGRKNRQTGEASSSAEPQSLPDVAPATFPILTPSRTATVPTLTSSPATTPTRTPSPAIAPISTPCPASTPSCTPIPATSPTRTPIPAPTPSCTPSPATTTTLTLSPAVPTAPKPWWARFSLNLKKLKVGKRRRVESPTEDSPSSSPEKAEDKSNSNSPNSPTMTPVPSPTESLEDFIHQKRYHDLKKLSRPWRVRDVWSEDEDGLLERIPSTYPESEVGMPLTTVSKQLSLLKSDSDSGVPVPQANTGNAVDSISHISGAGAPLTTFVSDLPPCKLEGGVPLPQEANTGNVVDLESHSFRASTPLGATISELPAPLPPGKSERVAMSLPPGESEGVPQGESDVPLPQANSGNVVDLESHIFGAGTPLSIVKTTISEKGLAPLPPGESEGVVVSLSLGESGVPVPQANSGCVVDHESHTSGAGTPLPADTATISEQGNKCSNLWELSRSEDVENELYYVPALSTVMKPSDIYSSASTSHTETETGVLALSVSVGSAIEVNIPNVRACASPVPTASSSSSDDDSLFASSGNVSCAQICKHKSSEFDVHDVSSDDDESVDNKGFEAKGKVLVVADVHGGEASDNERFVCGAEEDEIVLENDQIVLFTEESDEEGPSTSGIADEEQVVTKPTSAVAKTRKRKQNPRFCPIANCKAKIQQRLADHIRLSHADITPKKRVMLCKLARRGKARALTRPTGQRTLFSQQKKRMNESEFDNIFNSKITTSSRTGLGDDLTPGKGGSTRSMKHFPEESIKLLDFRKYLGSVDGGQKSRRTALEISSDVSKYLYFADPRELRWFTLLDEKMILKFLGCLEDTGIKAPGRLTKLERICDGLKYVRFGLRASGKGKEKLEEIRQVEATLTLWKANLRRQKKKRDVLRLEATSDDLPPLASLNSIMDSADIPRIFNSIVDRAEKGLVVSHADIRFAVAAVSIPLMLASSVRPGSIINMTQTEFNGGRECEGVVIVKVAEHKTNQKGTSRVLFDSLALTQARSYAQHIRPLAVCDKGDIPNFFVRPGSVPIDKMSNLQRVLEKRLGISIPNATTVRKMGTTEVARNCNEITRDLVARQMNHDPKTSLAH